MRLETLGAIPEEPYEEICDCETFCIPCSLCNCRHNIYFIITEGVLTKSV